MQLNIFRFLTTTIVASALLALPLTAQDPYDDPDDSWISISGTVESVAADEFTLDYGDGFIIVEMDDGDRDADGYKLVQGDKVTVNGVIDDDFLELRTIEASSVYVENIGTYFYASAVDEEDIVVTVSTPVIVGDVVIQGTVTSVGAEEFTLNTGTMQIIVETDQMPYDPLDNIGYQQIDVGDRVSVMGHIDTDLFEGTEIVAESIVTLVN